MKNSKSNIKNILYGFLIGASVLVPGFSGGTTAIIIGIYNDILEAVDGLLSRFKINFLYLMSLLLGALPGFYICSFPLSYLIDRYPVEFSYFIIGVIFGSVPLFIRKAEYLKHKNIIWTTIGFVLIIGLDMISGLNFTSHDGVLFMILVSILSAVALILPGISLTNILIALGYYETIIISVKTFDIYFLTKFSLILMISILMFTKVLNRIYKKYPVSINMLILGMVLASVKQVFIRMPIGNEMISCVLLLISGVMVSLAFVRFEIKTDSI